MLAPWKKSYYQPRQHMKKQRHYFVDKGLSSQSYGFSSSHIWMWELDYKRKLSAEELMLLNCGAGEDSLSSPLDYKEIQPVHPKGNQSWIFIGKTDAEAETPKLWSPDVKKWLIWKPWCWEKLKAGGERDDRGWIGWMGSLARWKWVWVSSSGWWWAGKPGVLQSMGSQSWTWLSNWTGQQRDQISQS